MPLTTQRPIFLPRLKRECLGCEVSRLQFFSGHRFFFRRLERGILSMAPVFYWQFFAPLEMGQGPVGVALVLPLNYAPKKWPIPFLRAKNRWPIPFLEESVKSQSNTLRNPFFSRLSQLVPFPLEKSVGSFSRFSISWTRVMPLVNGTMRANSEGVKFYKTLGFGFFCSPSKSHGRNAFFGGFNTPKHRVTNAFFFFAQCLFCSAPKPWFASPFCRTQLFSGTNYIIFPFFWVAAPLKMAFPEKGSLLHLGVAQN